MLIGREPEEFLGFNYVTEGPYEAIILGSLTLGQLLHFSEERVLSFLSEGRPVYLYGPGLPEAGSKALSEKLMQARQELTALGVKIIRGPVRQVICGDRARELKARGKKPRPGVLLTPLAKDILEGSD